MEKEKERQTADPLAQKFDPAHLERIRSFRLMDDDFMNTVFTADKRAAEVVLQVIMGNENLVVDSVRVQEEIKGLRKRSIQMDVHIKDKARRVEPVPHSGGPVQRFLPCCPRLAPARLRPPHQKSLEHCSPECA